MFNSALANFIAAINQRFCEHGYHYALIYADTTNVTTGEVGMKLSSNFAPEQLGPLLGSMLEAGEVVKKMLRELFEAHPLQALATPMPVEGEVPVSGELVEVPTEQAVEMVLAALLSNLQLKGSAKKPSPIVLLG